MSCEPCTSNSPVSLQYSAATFNDCACEDCSCKTTIDARCVYYTGPALPCSLIATNDSLEDVLIKLDQRVCAITGNYALYNTYCLDEDGAINTEKQFVETISSYVCELNTKIDTFIDVTFGDYAAEVQNQINAVAQPSITCESAGVTDGDSVATVLEKYCDKFAQLDEALSLEGVNWSTCVTVIPAPDTLAEALNILIGQICQLNGGETVLPTFDNTSSCLGGTVTSTDSLVSTVSKIRDRLCETSVIDITTITWGCLTQPSVDPTDLQGALETIVGAVNTLIGAAPTFSDDFVVEPVDVDDPCAGVIVSLAPTSLDDKWFAIDGSDSAPGTFMQKVSPGSGISFDTITEPGKVIINSTGSGGGTDTRVKTRSADPSTGYLEDKLEGADAGDGVTISTTTDTIANKVAISATIDFELLWTKLLEELEANPTAAAAFCERVQDCLPDCVVPPNVTVIVQSTDQTTSTTTTTTTTL